ncbi:unnamed protein product [Caretta caretta]
MVPLGVVSAAAGIVALRVSLSTPAEDQSQIRRRKKRTWNYMFQEMLQACAASENMTRAWRMILGDSMEKERVERKKAWDSKQEKERGMHLDTMGFLRQKTEMLWTLVDLQLQESHACLPLQPIDNSMLGPFYIPLQHST